MERHIEYAIQVDINGQESGAKGFAGKAILDDRNLTIHSDQSKPLIIPYFQILSIDEKEYRVKIRFINGMMTLSQLGYEYENFLKNLFKLRGELLLRYTLMNEGLLAKGIEAHYKYSDSEGEGSEGDGEVRVYDSAVVMLPDKADPIRIPLCYVKNPVLKDYLYNISTDFGQSFSLMQMGEKTDYLARNITDVIKKMRYRAQELLTSLAPGVDPSSLSRAAELLVDGKAASRGEIESINPQLWLSLEENLSQAGISEEYAHLSGLSNKIDIRIGVKRGLMGDKTGQYTWFMVPLYDTDPNQPGNAVIIEAASDETSSRATYVFRIFDRKQYRTAMAESSLRQGVDSFMLAANQCMIDVNFRREPIYLSEERLLEPDYERYLYAVNRLHSLQFLREHFIGRVFHISQEKWKNDLADLLKFNVESVNNSEKWGRM